MGYIARLEDAFLAHCAHQSPARSLAFTNAGLVLGAGTLVAPTRREVGDALDLSGEDRILALLSAVFAAPVNRAVLGKLRRAGELWAQGDKRVIFDDCRESDGAMIEAKGHYEDARQDDFISESIDAKWVKQATRQVDASGGREIEWYFHEQSAADAASDLFEKDDKLKRIKIFVLPYPGSVPKYNPRINSLDDYWDYEDQQ